MLSSLPSGEERRTPAPTPIPGILTVRSVRYIGGGAKTLANGTLTALEEAQGSADDASWRIRTSQGQRQDERHSARMIATQTRSGGPAASAQGAASATLQQMVLDSMT